MIKILLIIKILLKYQKNTMEILRNTPKCSEMLRNAPKCSINIVY